MPTKHGRVIDMEETTNTTPAAEDVVPVKMGATLREARLRMGMSVADVCAQIRLAPRQIEALEADDFSRLPEMAFVRGFVRSYAKLLHLDAANLLAALPPAQLVSEHIEPASVEVPFSIKQLSAQQNQNWLIASAVVMVGVIAFAIWHFSTPKAEKNAATEKPSVSEAAIVLPEQNAAVSSVDEVNAGIDPDAPVSAVQPVPELAPALAATPAPAAKAPPATAVPVLKPATSLVQTSASKPQAASSVAPVSASKGTEKLRLVFDAESWTEVKDAQGKILSSQLNAAGSELSLNGSAPYELVIGNAKSVHVYRQGKAVDVDAHINSTSEVARLSVE
ncbi:MAG: RodZ domain-containing protein [Gallionella sp.]